MKLIIKNEILENNWEYDFKATEGSDADKWAEQVLIIRAPKDIT